MAGKVGARSGLKRSATSCITPGFDKMHSISRNHCRERYNQCKVLHDSYRFPGITQRYINAAVIAQNQGVIANDRGQELEIKEELDEYHMHEIKIFKKFQDKMASMSILKHELQKWLAKENKPNH